MTRTYLFMVGLLALLATGCLRMSTTLVVAEDGSGTGEIVMALDAAAFAELAAEDDSGLGAEELAELDPDQLCTMFDEEVPADDFPSTATVSDYSEDGFCGQRFEFTFADEAELVSVLGGMGDGGDAVTDGFKLRQEGNDWIFVLPLDQDIFAGGGDADLVQMAFLAQMEVVYQITLPGEAVDGENNADTVDGGTFTWDLDLTSPPDQLLARTTPSSGGRSVLVLVAAVIVVAVVGAAGLFVLGRSRRSATIATVPATPATDL